MKYIYYILSILFTLSFGSCKDDIPGSDNPNIGGITLTLTSGNMETRTNLTSTAATQNVETVYIALYKGNDDKATFVDAQDFGWKKSSLTSYEKQTKTLTFDNLEAGEEYILLAVGLDADSETTYGFDSETDFKDALNEKTLAEAKATLATNKTSEDIATSELFAGWNTFTYEPDIENKVEVEMKRRVAGVLCYITDIPTTINDGKENKKVQKLRLSLYTGEKPNNQISLCRKNISSDGEGIELPDDFGEYSDKGASLRPTKEGYLILNEVDLLTIYGEQTGETYVIPEINIEGLKVKANSLLFGNYVIPTKAAKGNATLRVELLDANDKILVFFNAERVGVNDNTTYDIYPNYIYHIGQKLESNSTDDDQPVSLLGKKLTVEPQEWTTPDRVDVEFPSVPVKPKMELDYGENYIFDCVPHTIKLTVVNSILDSPWILQIDGSQEGVYFKVGEIWKSKYEASAADLLEESVDIEVLISDYAELNAEDVRQVEINLISDNAIVVSHLIKQYNAIIFSMEDGNKNIVYRGFSHFDYGTERNKQTGEIISNGEYYQWGYDCDRAHLYIYNSDADDYNGETNLNNAKKEAETDSEKEQYFLSSAMHLAEKPCYSIVGDIASENTHKWYLPAFYELKAFFNYSVNQGKRETWNIVQNDKYWTSCILRDTYFYAYAFYIDSKSKVDYGNWWDNKRTDYNRIRQACIVIP